MTNYLQEAFQRLSLLEDDFPLSETDSLTKLKEYMEDDIEMPEDEVIIDPEADKDTELQDNYIGKVIVECSSCHTRLYKDEDDVVIDEETNLANVGEECPVCGSITGWNVIGKIESYDADRDLEAEAEAAEAEEEEATEEESDVPMEVDSEGEESEDDEFAEALKETLEEECDKPEEELEESVNEDDVCPDCGENPCVCEDKKFKKIRESKLEEMKNSDKLKKNAKKLKEEDCEEHKDELKEDLNEVEVHTDEGEVGVSKDGSKVTVDFGTTEEPMEAPETGEEMIAPLDDEDVANIEDNVAPEEEGELGDMPLEEPVEEEPTDEESTGEFDEFDEESFDDMGESYMRRVYENVQGYKTTDISENDGTLIVEGVITFTNGKEKNTKFVFENAQETKRGNIILEGYNSTFSSSKKSFIVKGSAVNGKYISESLLYNYTVKQLNESNNSETIKVRGRVKRK